VVREPSWLHVARAIPSREPDPPLAYLPDEFGVVTDDQDGIARSRIMP
jgi:hypothetical protein